MSATPEAWPGLHPRLGSLLTSQGWTTLTRPQEAALRPILDGEHALVVAPTGHGKTEAALLPILSRLLAERDRLEQARQPWPTGFKALYITPLRALNRDLMGRLQGWADTLGLHVGVRHGDTTQGERAKQARDPPDLLITTPETLQLLLYGDKLRTHLATVRFVVVDEIHDLAASERGAQLLVALERVEEVIGQAKPGQPAAPARERVGPRKPEARARGLQRIGLSATVADPQAVARLLGGRGPDGQPRPVRVLRVEDLKAIELEVELPTPGPDTPELAAKLLLPPPAVAQLQAIRRLVASHERVLVFQNTRDGAELTASRSALLDAEAGREPMLDLHHGSLSAEHRADVETRFKQGHLKGVVATSSLELGIDVGAIDHVVQVHSPRSIARLVQRLGRSGHTATGVARGTLLAAGPEDVLECLAVARRAKAGQLEPLRIRPGPLVVLANQIIALSNEYDGLDPEWTRRLIQRSGPFETLDPDLFDAVWDALLSLRTLYPKDDATRKAAPASTARDAPTGPERRGPPRTDAGVALPARDSDSVPDDEDDEALADFDLGAAMRGGAPGRAARGSGVAGQGRTKSSQDAGFDLRAAMGAPPRTAPVSRTAQRHAARRTWGGGTGLAGTAAFSQARIGRSSRGRRQFLDHVSLIPDETVYKVIDEATKRSVGTVDDAFVAAAMPPGALFVMAGRSWQVLEIQAEAKRVRVAPAKDLAAVPQWTGSLLPVSYEVAQEVAHLRALVAAGVAVPGLAGAALEAAAAPILEHAAGGPVPTDTVVTVESGKRVAIANVALGTRGNEALGRITQALLHQRLGQPVGMECDAYRIHFTFPSPRPAQDVVDVWQALEPRGLDVILSLALRDSPMLRHHLVHVAKLFGALPTELDPNLTTRAKLDSLMTHVALEEESVSRLVFDRMDVDAVKTFLAGVAAGTLTLHVRAIGPLSLLGQEQTRGLMALPRTSDALLAAVRKRIEDADLLLACVLCGNHWPSTVHMMSAKPKCRRCQSIQVAALRPWHEDKMPLLRRKDLGPEERDERDRIVRNAALVSSYGPVAARCLAARGIGPDTAARILQKVSDPEDPNFWRQILEAELTFARTNVHWAKKG